MVAIVGADYTIPTAATTTKDAPRLAASLRSVTTSTLLLASWRVFRPFGAHVTPSPSAGVVPEKGATSGTTMVGRSVSHPNTLLCRNHAHTASIASLVPNVWTTDA